MPEERVPPGLAASFLDQHGQPLGPFNRARRDDRTVHELLGFIRGVLADDIVCPAEVITLAQWLLANIERSSGWPADVVCARVADALKDGYVATEECQDLEEILRELIGRREHCETDENASTDLPFTRPAPDITFMGRVFVLTGKFYYGPRHLCQQAIVDRGGECGSTPTKKTHVLVIGEIGSRDWIHTSFGRKIESAVDYIRAGAPTVIVSEEHWTKYL